MSTGEGRCEKKRIREIEGVGLREKVRVKEVIRKNRKER